MKRAILSLLSVVLILLNVITTTTFAMEDPYGDSNPKLRIEDGKVIVRYSSMNTNGCSDGIFDSQYDPKSKQLINRRKLSEKEYNQFCDDIPNGRCFWSEAEHSWYTIVEINPQKLGFYILMPRKITYFSLEDEGRDLSATDPFASSEKQDLKTGGTYFSTLDPFGVTSDHVLVLGYSCDVRKTRPDTKSAVWLSVFSKPDSRLVKKIELENPEYDFLSTANTSEFVVSGNTAYLAWIKDSNHFLEHKLVLTSWDSAKKIVKHKTVYSDLSHDSCISMVELDGKLYLAFHREEKENAIARIEVITINIK